MTIRPRASSRTPAFSHTRVLAKRLSRSLRESWMADSTGVDFPLVDLVFTSAHVIASSSEAVGQWGSRSWTTSEPSEAFVRRLLRRHILGSNTSAGWALDAR